MEWCGGGNELYRSERKFEKEMEMEMHGQARRGAEGLERAEQTRGSSAVITILFVELCEAEQTMQFSEKREDDACEE